MNNLELLNHTKNLMQIGAEKVRMSPHLATETGTLDAKGTPTIAMDKALEKTFLQYIEANQLPVTIYSEDSNDLTSYHAQPNYLLLIDPLDGSTNYKIGYGLLPFGSFFTIFKNFKPQLSDVVVAGAIEYTSNQRFVSIDGQTADIDGHIVRLKSDWPLEPVPPTVHLELYKDGYEAFAPLSKKLRIFNQGALVNSVTSVLSNISALMGGIAVRSEEIGALYALITGAGGVMVDLQGNDIGNQPLDHARKYEILAGSKSVVEYALSYVKRSQ